MFNSSNVPTYFCARYFPSLSLVIATTTLSQYLHHNAPKLNIYGHKYRTSASIGDTVVCKLVMNIGKIDNFEIGSRALSRPLSRIDLSSSTAGFALKRDNCKYFEHKTYSKKVYVMSAFQRCIFYDDPIKESPSGIIS